MILRLSDLCKKYARGGVTFQAVKDVNLEVEAGDYVNIVGRSGSGKSTLLNMAAGMLTPTSGDVELDGQSLKGKDDNQISFLRNDLIGFIPQGMATLPNLTVLENILLPFYLYPREGEGEEIAHFILKKLGIEPLINSYPQELSGGELRRVLIARSLINSPKILIADEPTSDLDVESTKRIMDVFSELNEDGVTLLLVSHDLDAVEYGKTVYTMVSGELVSGNLFQKNCRRDRSLRIEKQWF